MPSFMDSALMRKIAAFFALMPLCFGVENNLFSGFSVGLPYELSTTYDQSIYKDSSSCNNGSGTFSVAMCYGGTSHATYKGGMDPSFSFIFGDEVIFDSMRISGLRIYTTLEMGNAWIGDRQSYSTTTTSAKFYGSDGKTQYSMLNPNTPQSTLAANALSTTISLGIDFFANIPIDVFLKKIWRRTPEFKLGIFAGFGAEFNLLKSTYWVNESLANSEKEDAFYASGNGIFVNLGTSLYLSRHDRIDFGVKIPYYTLTQVMWHIAPNSSGAIDSNLWAQQTLRQTFEIHKSLEFKISYIFYF